MPQLYIISGCNGAGKTTASETILPEMLNCREFVNADNIARGLSPFNVESVAFEAGRIMLTRIEELLEERADFAIETTLSTRSYHTLVRKAQQIGYKVTLLFVWLQDVNMAKERVAKRVSLGGHDIPPHLIERRYHRGLYNLFHTFIPLVDAWLLVNNSNGTLEHIADGEKNLVPNIENNYLWQRIHGNAIQKYQ
ncbi:MAG: zeta toxin family protein [Chitinophagaceae bacterium]|jgi:predicted ABC-type ATPase|nr:zeta toxin family protein [Chitinophagaceae bacterium]